MSRWENINENLCNKQIVVFGCGNVGKILIEILYKKNVNSILAFDNSAEKIGSKIEGVSIVKPQKQEKESIYIIAMNDMEQVQKVNEQLKEMGIKESDVFIFNDKTIRDYKKTLSMAEIEIELEEICKQKFGNCFNIKKPKTYTEIINWEKTHINDSVRTLLVDKVAVRGWVAEKIGEEYLNKVYKVYENENEIDFDSMPERYVLKLNNGSGRNIIVNNKNQVDRYEIVQKLREWRKSNYAYNTYEMQYKDIPPKIICEEFMEGIAENLYDYNIYCFHGEPKYIHCIKGSHRPGCRAAYYDLNWNKQEFEYGCPMDPDVAPKPEKLEEMLCLTRKLCKGFKHVRVDWYILATGEIKFGEMTFSSWSGLEKFKPDKYDDIFGELIWKK